MVDGAIAVLLCHCDLDTSFGCERSIKIRAMAVPHALEKGITFSISRFSNPRF
jgi:hypothetical protein